MNIKFSSLTHTVSVAFGKHLQSEVWIIFFIGLFHFCELVHVPLVSFTTEFTARVTVLFLI